VAKEITTTLIDDIDGGKAAESIQYSLDGKDYEIDLSKSNGAKLRKALEPYIKVSRQVKVTRTRAGGRGKRSTTSARSGLPLADIRAWAEANNIAVAPRGRIAQSVIEKYTAATSTNVATSSTSEE